MSTPPLHLRSIHHNWSPEVLRSATFSWQATVRLPRMLLMMLRYARDRLLELCDSSTEAPEVLLNSGIGVWTREDESIRNPERLRNRSNSTEQLKKAKCTAELYPAIVKKNDFGMNHCLGVLTREDEIVRNPESLRNRFNSTQQLQKDKCTAELSPVIRFPASPTRRNKPAKKDDLGMNHCLGGQSEKEKEEIYSRKDVNTKLQGILSKLEVSQDYALLARQVRQEGIPSVETLRGVMSLIFENAAMHPAQCTMYAQLCVLLSKLELPEYPRYKTMTFQSVLLNTCQEEFKKLTKPEQAVERDYEKGKRVKLRTLGTIKLIGELFNEKLLPEKIVHACIQELLGQDPKAFPAEENVEVLCHLLRTVGKQLEESTKSKMAFDTYFAQLKVIGESTALPSRIQHMVRGVFDLRSKKWVSPQEEMQAKKINKIPAKAKLEQRPETMALRKVRPAAAPMLSPGGGGMVPGMSVVPSILGMPGMPGGGGPDQRRKVSVDKETLLSVPVASAPSVKVMEFGSGRVAAMPKLRVLDHFGVRANKDNFNLRDLLQRVRTFDK